MNLLDRIRIERAVQSYDLWLDLRGASMRRRRGLRRELRANLAEATADVGSRTAVDRLGSTRSMAVVAVPSRRGVPRWSVGGTAAVVALALTLLAQVLAALAWLDGVLDAAGGQAVTGALTFFPGSTLEYTPMGDGFGLALGVGWLPWALGLLVFVLVARPWRLLARAETTA